MSQPDRTEDKEDDADNGARNALHQSDDELGAPKAKLYRSLPDQVSLAFTIIIIIIIIVTKFSLQVFDDTLLAKTMVSCLERQRSSMGFVLAFLVDTYHEQLRDEVGNPRPPNWPVNEYLKHSAFQSEKEWRAYTESHKNRYRDRIFDASLYVKSHVCSGLSSGTRPDTGLSPHLQKWAQLKYDKWLVMKRDILNNTHAEWVRLFPNGVKPSGVKMWEQQDKLKLILFKQWMMAPTKRGAPANYKPQEMPSHYLPFTTWNLWCQIGPGGAFACDCVVRLFFETSHR